MIARIEHGYDELHAYGATRLDEMITQNAVGGQVFGMSVYTGLKTPVGRLFFCAAMMIH